MTLRIYFRSRRLSRGGLPAFYPPRSPPPRRLLTGMLGNEKMGTSPRAKTSLNATRLIEMMWSTLLHHLPFLPVECFIRRILRSRLGEGSRPPRNVPVRPDARG